MPCVPVRLASSKSCICLRRTPPAHPGSRGKNRYQPQPSFHEATRTGGGLLMVIETLSIQVGREGDPCTAPKIPLPWELHSARSSAYMRPMRGTHNPATVGITQCVFSLLGQILHCWVGQYGRGTSNELARCCSRNTPTPLSHAYLVEPLSRLPGLGEG